MYRAALQILLALGVAAACTACAPTPQAADVAPAEPTEPAEPAPAETPEPSVAEHKNTIKWGTASEVDNFGYDVYRGDAEEGPFARITEEPIPGAGTTDSPSTYSYTDENIDPTRSYWYYVESISMSNVRERFTPIYQAKPKIGGETPGEETEETAEP